MNCLRKIALIPLALLLFFQAKSQGSGAELSYRCLDASGNYEITLVYYRQCGAPAVCAGGNCSSLSGCSQTVEVYGGDPAYINSKFLTISLFGVSVRDVVNHPSCPDIKSVCDNMGCVTPGKLTTGYERYEFKGTVNIGASSGIPANCCNIRFTFNECCRSNLIQSYTGTNANYYTDAIVNRCAATYPNCVSPVFHNDPVFTIVAGFPFYYNNGAFDEDHDSLVYSFTPALQGYNTPVTYTAPYTYDLPMNYTLGPNVYPNGMKCDPVTGDIYFKPSSFPFYGGIAIRVDQYRKVNNTLTLVGVTRRDVPLHVISSVTDNAPQIRTIPAGTPAVLPKTVWETCAESMLCFDVIAKDTDFAPPTMSDTTFLRWDSVLAKYGATFLPLYSGSRDTAGPREDSYRFCWSPPDSVANTSNGQPFTFTVTAEDQACPYNGFVTRAFTIKVYQRADVTVQHTMRDCNRGFLSYTRNPNITPAQLFTAVQWKIATDTSDWTFSNGATILNNVQTTPDIYFPKAGRYLVMLTITTPGPSGGSCTRSFYDTITVVKSLLVRSSSDTSFCAVGNPLTIKMTQTDPDVDQISWYALPDTQNVLVTVSQFNITANKSNTYLLRAFDTETGCFFSDTTYIRVSALRPKFSVNKATQCFKGNSFNFTNQSSDSLGGAVNYTWVMSTGDTSINPTSFQISFGNVGDYKAKIRMRNAIGCKDSTEMQLSVFVSPTMNFSVTTDSVQCLKGNSFTVNNQTTASEGLLFNWSLGNGNTSSASQPPAFNYTTTGVKNIKLIATTNTHACEDSLIRQVRIIPSPNVGFLINNPVQCQKGNQFAFTNTSSISSGSITQVWLFGDGGTNTLSSPVKIYAQSGLYNVRLKVTSNLGCTDSTQQAVNVLPSPVASFTITHPKPCFGEVYSFNNTTQLTQGSYTSSWNFGDGNTSSNKNETHTYANTGSFVIELKTVSDQQCRDSVQSTATVNDIPLKPLITGDSLVIKHSNMVYTVTDNAGSTYTWTITGDSAHVISNNQVTVSWGPSDSGRVQVTETSSAGCNSEQAALKVKVRPKAGLTDVSQASWITVYPQPASHELFIQGETKNLLRGELYSITGKLIRVYYSPEIEQKKLDVDGIQSGVYFLEFKARGGQSLVKRIEIINP